MTVPPPVVSVMSIKSRPDSPVTAMCVDVDGSFPGDYATFDCSSRLIVASPPRPLAVVSPISVCEASVISVISPVSSAMGGGMVSRIPMTSYGLSSPVLTSTPISRTPPCDTSGGPMEPCAKKARRGSLSSNDDSTFKALHHSSTSSSSTAPYSTSTTPQPGTNASDVDQKHTMQRINLEKSFASHDSAMSCSDISRTSDKSSSQLDHLNHMVDKQFADNEVKQSLLSPGQIPELVDRQRYVAMRCSRTAGIDLVILRRKLAQRRPLQQPSQHRSPAHQHPQHPHTANKVRTIHTPTGDTQRYACSGYVMVSVHG